VASREELLVGSGFAVPVSDVDVALEGLKIQPLELLGCWFASGGLRQQV